MARVALLVLSILASVSAFTAPSSVVARTTPLSAVGAWEKDYYSTVNVDPSQLDTAFLSANGQFSC